MFLAVRLVYFATCLKDGRPRGNPSSRLPIRVEDAREGAGVHGGGGADAGAGDWREHGNVQHAIWIGLAAVAVRGFVAVGDAVGFESQDRAETHFGDGWFLSDPAKPSEKFRRYG